MESLFHKRGLNVTVSLRNNHNTYLAASNDERSLILVSPTTVGSTPKNAEWTINFRSATSQFTEFSLWSIHGKELATQKREDGEIQVCQQNPNSSKPFCWRSDNSQPPTGGIYLFCNCESRDWISDVYKLSATQDGIIEVKPSFDDTWLDPGSWWFIEVIDKSTGSESSDSELAVPKTGSIASVLHQPSTMHHLFADIKEHQQQATTLGSPYHDAWGAPGSFYQFLAGQNSNGSGNQNIGDVKIKNKISVSPIRKAGYGMTPDYNYEGPYFGINPTLSAFDEEQPAYNPEQPPVTFVPSKDDQGNITPYTGHGAFSSQNHYMGNGTQYTTTTSMNPFSGVPVMSTYINAGNNSNGSGTQTNNVSIKNKGPIYKYW